MPKIEYTLPNAENLRISKRANLFLSLIPLAFMIGLATGFLLWGNKQDGNPQAALDTVPVATQEFTRYEVIVENQPVLGPENASVTIVEFSDYECPFCTKWHVEVWPRIRETFPDQVRLVYIDFPLTSIHGNAAQASEASHCAGDQNQFWQYHDLLFKAESGLGVEAYKQYATDLGLDLEEFDACLENRKYQEKIQANMRYAADLGVRSTPTFFINGIAVVGAQPFEVFQDIIIKELAGEIP